MDTNIFGNKLRTLMEEKNLEGKEFAKQIHVQPPTVSNWLNGNRFPNQDTLKKIADYFDVSIDYLLGRTNIRKFGPRKIYSAEELVEILPEEYKELFLEQNIGYIEFAMELMKEQINPNDIIELIKVAQNVRKEYGEKGEKQ